MSICRPRAVLTAAIFLLFVVLGLFALAPARSHADDRRDAERRFVERARISAAPTESLFSSTSAQDIVRTYELGVNSFISKPVTFLGLVDVMKTFSRYWLEIVDLPPHGNGQS